MTVTDTAIKAVSKTTMEGVAAAANPATEAAAITAITSTKTKADTEAASTVSRETTATTNLGESRKAEDSTDTAASSGLRIQTHNAREQASRESVNSQISLSFFYMEKSI